MFNELNDSNYCQYLTEVPQNHNNYHDACHNCLQYGYTHSLRPRFWFENIKQFFRNLHFAYQRIKYGYCDWDMWCMDTHILSLLADMLDDLATNSHAYPGIAPFDTYEKWQSALYINAYKLRVALDIDGEHYKVTDALREQYKNEAFEWIKENTRFLWD